MIHNLQRSKAHEQNKEALTAFETKDGKVTGVVINLDLGYAPPFSPVWDPVVTAARVLAKKL